MALDGWIYEPNTNADGATATEQKRRYHEKLENYYSVCKINLQPPRHIDFGDKNALLDQNFGFACST